MSELIHKGTFHRDMLQYIHMQQQQNCIVHIQASGNREHVTVTCDGDKIINCTPRRKHDGDMSPGQIVATHLMQHEFC